MKPISIVCLVALVVLLAEMATYQFTFDYMNRYYQKQIEQNQQDNIEYMQRIRSQS